MSATSPFDELRKVLENAATQAAIAAGVGEALHIEGYRFNQPKDSLWVHFDYTTGDTFASAMGQGDVEGQPDRVKFHRTVGIVEFNILYPENGPKAVPTKVADLLRKRFSMKKWAVADVGHVTIAAMGQKPVPGAPKGFVRIMCDAVLDFHYRD